MEKQNQPDALDRALTDLYRSNLPEGYRAAWRAAVQREEQSKMKTTPKHKTFWRVALTVAAAAVLVFGAISAGNLIPTVVNDTLQSMPIPQPAQNGGGYDEGFGGAPGVSEASDAAYSSEQSARNEMGYLPAATMNKSMAMIAQSSSSTESEASVDSANAPATSAKIVRTADLTIATTSFDADTEAVTQLTEKLGGYIASVNLSGEPSVRKDRVAYYSLRIPSDQLEAFLTEMESVGRITQRNETATDKTTEYSDTQMRLKTQQDKMTRLQELLKQAADVSDLLEIESEIADTQYQIDSLESSLRTIDRDVEKSSVTVTLEEQSDGQTAQTVELTLWQRIGSGFAASVKGIENFLQNLTVFIAMLLPALLPAGVIAVLVWLGVRARRRARLAKKPETAPTDVPAQTAEIPEPKENEHQ